jgi:signal transduction histidine kinase
MKIHFNSIKLKMTVFYTFILVLLLIAFHFIAYMLLSYGLFNNLRDSMANEVSKVMATLSNVEEDALFENLINFEGILDSSIFLYDVVSGEIFSSYSIPAEIQLVTTDYATIETSNYTQFVSIQDIREFLYITPLDIDTKPGKMLVVTRDSDYIYRTIDEYKQLLYIAIPFIIVFALLSGYLISSYFLRQLNAITLTAENIDPSNPVARIPVKSEDELGRLSTKLNSLFNQIYGFINRQRQFTADASHDLRAPLTNIKAEATLALRKPRSPQEYQDVLKRIDRETEHLNSMVDDLLTLASMDTQPERSRTINIDLSEFIGSILNDWEAQYTEKGVKLVRRIAPDIEIRGELLHFNQIVDNLLKNALEYTSAGGEVTCSLEFKEKDIIITVSDSGIGISEKDLPHVFDRFYKVDRDTPGNGLGLPIVEGTVKMYGGNITVESELGKGTIFTITIPAIEARLTQ